MWGTCAGLILLSNRLEETMKGQINVRCGSQVSPAGGVRGGPGRGRVGQLPWMGEGVVPILTVNHNRNSMV